MCVCVCFCADVCMCLCLRAFVFLFLLMCVQIHMFASVCVDMYKRSVVFVCVHLHVYVYASMHVCVCIICVCVYVCSVRMCTYMNTENQVPVNSFLSLILPLRSGQIIVLNVRGSSISIVSKLMLLCWPIHWGSFQCQIFSRNASSLSKHMALLPVFIGNVAYNPISKNWGLLQMSWVSPTTLKYSH